MRFMTRARGDEVMGIFMARIQSNLVDCANHNEVRL